jgi:hypothetical protein
MFTSIGLVAAWEGLLLLDSCVFGLTVVNAYTTTRRMGPLVNLPLHRVIVRDGALPLDINQTNLDSDVQVLYILRRLI